MSPASVDHADEESDGEEVLVEGFKGLSVDSKSYHFLGRSSNFALVRAAIDLKKGLVNGCEKPRLEDNLLISHRPEFWELAEAPIESDPPYTDFPDTAMMSELVDNFFLCINTNFPLLHRPTFERSIRSGLHLRDEGFGATVLLVCALSARQSPNPAVLVPGAPNWHWAGWQWFEQVRSRRRLIPMLHTRLYDLQVATLAAAYVSASPVAHPNYAIIGHGIRLAQDLGAHRRTTYPSTPTVESELRKRAFWLLVAMDRGMCSILGRPCSIQEEDFDVDYPIECDDEYWEMDDPQLAFKQPPGKPSYTASFNCMIRLMHIHAYCLRGLYSLRGSKLLSDPQRAQELVSELDSELNRWLDSIPEHLKWDPHQPNDLWASQSASLFAAYYGVRIIIHRPFIPMPRKPSPLPFPSLAICTNAARSCVQALERYFTRFGPVFMHNHHQLTLFTAAIILLLNIWGGPRTGSTVDAAKEMEEVNKALRILKDLEPRWNSACRYWDVLHDLMTAVDPAQNQGAPRTLKRRRDDPAPLEDGGPSVFAPAADSFAYEGAPQARPFQASSAPFPQSLFDVAPPAPDHALPGSVDDFAFGGLWRSNGAQQQQQQQQPFDAPPQSMSGPADDAMSLDADLEAIFADLLPTSSYDSPFLAAPASLFSNHLFSGAGLGAEFVQQEAFAAPQQPQQPSPMWSAGPEPLA
ncbi:uncharacterized protein PHACADRAFT_193830 [Phanerochaete carnosa HHB-10118-sp]|uniref:Xylanolytic transcriptional activator regulatory domain-containing protein n=1 Tax=Phanerochaete carnosa (strain HHB-10118-sp) TaxID=650164 RepID=K5WHW6_PHACS|nr:uncharacterized protein PHACADRAFT_193830 [Phanerochaete carnosa HHB-10118-sp]EKM58714.1 hypothetical protein PHACADRAFT_193830 [Phanerochaete carnosa HHB-10118-sp]